MTSNFPSIVADHDRLAQNIRILGGKESSSFLSEAYDLSNHIHTSSLGDGVYFDNLEILEHIDKLLIDWEQKLLDGLRLMMPRLNNSEKEVAPNPIYSLSLAFDSGKSHILSGLKTIPSDDLSGIPSQQWLKTLLILGAPALASFDVSALPSYIERIIFVESSPRDLAIGLLFSDLSVLIKAAKSNGIGIQFLFESHIPSLQSLIRSQLIGWQPTTLFGVNVVGSPVTNTSLAVVESWLSSPEGITQCVAGGLGGEVDEINQVLQASINAQINPVRRILSPLAGLADKPVVVVGSGPSLDTALPWLKKYGHMLQIIAAGSSLGVLLRNGIQPASAVFLERCSAVYETDLMELIQEKYDLGSIPLIASITLDPRISQLFKTVAWFHRPLSSALALFPDEAEGKLLQSGPQSANAALEAVLHLGHKRILIIGCDFSASDPSYPRARQAIGPNNRDLTLPVLGRHGKTVFSNAQLYDAAQYFSNAIRAYNPYVASVKSGINLDDVQIDLVDLNDELFSTFHNTTPLSSEWESLSTYVVTSTALRSRIKEANDAFGDLISRLTQLVSQSKCWNLHLARDLDLLFKLDESGLGPSQVLVKRLCHYPLLMSVMPLHDSVNETDWDKSLEITLFNLEWIKEVYETYFSFLIQNIDHIDSTKEWSFKWDSLRSLLFELTSVK